MNRIKLSPLASQSFVDTLDETPPKSLVPAVSSVPSEHELSLFVPLHYEKNYNYPLVVWLHSDGQAANQVQDVMLDLSMQNYVAMGVQSPNGNRKLGFFWDQDLETIEQTQQAVASAIDQACARCNIHPGRIFIAGMGSGGTMAFRVGFSRPDLFAGIMSIHGPMPTEHSPLRDWSRCRKLPIYWTHGKSSRDFDQDQLCQQLRLLHIAGFTVNLRQYTQTESTCPQMMADMNRWIMEMISTAVIQ